MDLQKIKQKLVENPDKVFDALGMECETFNGNTYSTCPIHGESDNPRAFSYSLNKGIWKCWTHGCEGDYSNDIFGLIRGTLSMREGRDIGFSGALKWACSLLGVRQSRQKSVTTTTKAPDSDEFCKLVAKLQSVNTATHFSSIKSPVVNCPSPYFLSRKYLPETLVEFGVGDCNTKKSLMYNRAVVPIHSEDGKNVVALIGRAIEEYMTPKFLIYPTNLEKSGIFYNYHRAIDAVTKTHTLFLLEGQGDVWRLWEAGVRNAMSVMGKSLSDKQISQIQSLPITNLVILADDDQPGREFKTQIQRRLNRIFTLSFPRFSHLGVKDVGAMTVEQIEHDILPQVRGAFA